MGGVLVTNVNERSSKIEISAGITMPRWFSVAALYALQKSMMLMPCGPSAVPTGGAGVAWPAGIWIFTIAASFFFAISIRSFSASAGYLRLAVVRSLASSSLAPLARRRVRRTIAARARVVVASYSLATWPSSSSTGVSRPKMFTSTVSFERATSMSEIAPLKSANGPVVTRTCSPTSYSSRGRTFFS